MQVFIILQGADLARVKSVVVKSTVANTPKRKAAYTVIEPESSPQKRVAIIPDGGAIATNGSDDVNEVTNTQEKLEGMHIG